MLMLAFSGNAFLGTDSAAGRDAQRYISILVEEGDTLWGIAKSYGKNVDCRRLIYEIEKLNGVSAETLRAGQYITIPFDVL